MHELCPLPERLSGPIGFVLQFTPEAEEKIRQAARAHQHPSPTEPSEMEALLESRPPHSTLSHATIVDTESASLREVLYELRRRLGRTELHFQRIVLIGGRFQVLQDPTPDAALQLTAILAGLSLRRWVRLSGGLALRENLQLTSGQHWCLQELGHPLALPDVGNGQYDRPLHTSFSYWKGERPLVMEPVTCDIRAAISSIRLAEIGSRGVISRFFDA